MQKTSKNMKKKTMDSNYNTRFRKLKQNKKNTKNCDKITWNRWKPKLQSWNHKWTEGEVESRNFRDCVVNVTLILLIKHIK